MALITTLIGGGLAAWTAAIFYAAYRLGRWVERSRHA